MPACRCALLGVLAIRDGLICRSSQGTAIALAPVDITLIISRLAPTLRMRNSNIPLNRRRSSSGGGCLGDIRGLDLGLALADGALVAAAEVDEDGDAEGKADAEEDGDDDLDGVEGVAPHHAHGVAIVVLGADVLVRAD